MIEVWESREAAQRFFDEQLAPVLQKFGIAGEDRFFEVYNTIQP